MKQNDIPGLRKLDFRDLANIFNVVDAPKEVGIGFKIYNINRTLNITGLENLTPNFFGEYEVQLNDTWPLISFKVYSTIKLYWLILKSNGIIDPTIDPQSGEILKILNQNVVDQILRRIREE